MTSFRFVLREMTHYESMEKWLTTMVAGFTLCVAPVAAVSAASAAQILLYGAASMAMARQQLMKMDDQNQKQMLASTQAKTGVLDDEAYSRRVETIQRNLVATGLVKRNYDVYVNPSKELNAFETVGGVISINRGMVEALMMMNWPLPSAMKCSTVKSVMP